MWQLLACSDPMHVSIFLISKVLQSSIIYRSTLGITCTVMTATCWHIGDCAKFMPLLGFCCLILCSSLPKNDNAQFNLRRV